MVMQRGHPEVSHAWQANSSYQNYAAGVFYHSYDRFANDRQTDGQTTTSVDGQYTL